MAWNNFSSRSRRGQVRVLADENPCTPGRRDFLRTLAAQGVSISALYLLRAGGAGASTSSVTSAIPAALRPARGGKIIRDFSSPYLELTRLLREATEIEHALMLQYLYAAFSLRPDYEAIAGYGAPTSTDLIGVAVQEMQHLAAVNRLLVALGAAPNLVRQEFPYEPDIYPFAFSLEPLSRKSLAKYIYAEAPADIFSRDAAPEDRKFADAVLPLLGSDTRVNHIGSLYDAIIARLEDYSAVSKTTLDSTDWLRQLRHIKEEGEREHFTFFRSVFEGRHSGFGERPGVWDLPPTDPGYPALALPVNPTAFVGHDGEIEDTRLLALSWLGNVHYWIALFLLDLHFREPQESQRYLELARLQMLGPVWSLARHLPKFGGGMPFDVLSIGYAPGRDASQSCFFAMEMLREAQLLAAGIGDLLPADYPGDMNAQTLHELQEMGQSLPRISSPRSAPERRVELSGSNAAAGSRVPRP